MLNRRREALVGLSFLITVSGFGANTLAADLGGNCCADLEERIAELENTTARKGNRKLSLTIGGQVNEALLFWDDGKESDVYQGTNFAARSRFRFVGDAKINSDWSTGYLLEVGVTSNRLNRTDQFTGNGFVNTPTGPESASVLDVRFSTFWLQNKDVGRLWVGKTDQSSERITEITLANTNNFLKHYGRWNGSFILRAADGPKAGDLLLRGGAGTTGLTWGNIMPQTGAGEGVPGEGDRFNVVKFDTREFGGFVASFAYGEGEFWDTALRYGGSFSGFKLAWGIGYADYQGNANYVAASAGPPASTAYLNSDVRGCAIKSTTDDKFDCETLGFSGSIMHEDSGLYVFGAYGQKWDKYRDANFAADVKPFISGTDTFFAINAGIEKKFFDLGRSTFYGEYESYDTGGIISGNGLTRTGLPRNLGGAGNYGSYGLQAFGTGAQTNVWGLGFNQNIEKASIDLYLAWRRAEAEIETRKADGSSPTTTKIEPIDMVMTGAVIKF